MQKDQFIEVGKIWVDRGVAPNFRWELVNVSPSGVFPRSVTMRRVDAPTVSKTVNRGTLKKSYRPSDENQSFRQSKGQLQQP